MEGKIRKIFPGANTANGSFNFFDNIIQGDINRIFCFKGGPGVGKSSLMKKIAQEFIDRGYDVELHHCPSDPSSLDALLIKKLGVVLLDGTSPHIVDPKNPGAVDEIVNLGEFWNVENLEKNKDEIIKLANVNFSDKPVKVSKNITYLGQIPYIMDFENRKLMGEIEIDGEYKDDYIMDDSALLYDTSDGIYIITGCSHSGICNIIEYAKKVSGKDKVLGIIGGTHLQEINEQLYKTIEYFKENNIKELYPCHCTKFYVKAEMFKNLDIKDAHVGLEINW